MAGVINDEHLTVPSTLLQDAQAQPSPGLGGNQDGQVTHGENVFELVLSIVVIHRVLPQSTVGVLSLTYLHATVWAVI